MTNNGSGAGCVRFTSAKKRLDEGEGLNAIAKNAVAQVPRKNKWVKATATYDSGSEDDPDNYNSENLNTQRDSEAEWWQASEEWQETPKLHVKYALA